MNNILSANLMRLRKNKLFWGCIGVIFLFSVFSMIGADTHLPSEMLQSNYILKEKYFSVLPVLGMFFAIFSSLYIGTEYSDGTIRNKLIVGHSKATVYISNLATVLIASIPMVFAWAVSGIIGVPAFKMGTIEWQEFLKYILMYILSVIALNSIFTLSAMLISKKAESAVFSILFFICMLICTSAIYNMLCKPEMISNLYIGGNGEQMIPNPNYLGGKIRTVLEFIMDILPTGQVLQIVNLDIINPVRIVILSILITITTTVGGVFLFRTKDIK